MPTMSGIWILSSILSYAGLKLKRKKYKSMQPSVEYLGYLIDKEVTRPMARKVDAICDAPALSNITELRSVLGMTQYYAKFIFKVFFHFDQPPKYIVEEGLHLEMGIGAKSSFCGIKKATGFSTIISAFQQYIAPEINM